MIDVCVYVRPDAAPYNITDLRHQIEKQVGQMVRGVTVRQDRMVPCPLAVLTDAIDVPATI